jgi:translation elongation factor EF-1beta
MEIKEKIKPDRVAREPLAFGLSALLVTKLVADAAGEVEKVENQIKEIKGSGQIDVVEVSRVL